MQQVADTDIPSIADIKRQLSNTAHELSTLSDPNTITYSVDAHQALYRVREALAHLEAAEKAKA
jgi:hypothetical protein